MNTAACEEETKHKIRLMFGNGKKSNNYTLTKVRQCNLIFPLPNNSILPLSLSDKCVAFLKGLRPQIWGAFIDRFNIPNIAEFYGSTEGNSNISK